MLHQFEHHACSLCFDVRCTEKTPRYTPSIVDDIIRINPNSVIHYDSSARYTFFPSSIVRPLWYLPFEGSPLSFWSLAALLRHMAGRHNRTRSFVVSRGADGVLTRGAIIRFRRTHLSAFGCHSVSRAYRDFFGCHIHGMHTRTSPIAHRPSTFGTQNKPSPYSYIHGCFSAKL